MSFCDSSSGIFVVQYNRQHQVVNGWYCKQKLDIFAWLSRQKLYYPWWCENLFSNVCLVFKNVVYKVTAEKIKSYSEVTDQCSAWIVGICHEDCQWNTWTLAKACP